MPTTLKKNWTSLLSLSLLVFIISQGFLNAQLVTQYRSFQYFSQYYNQLSLYNPAYVAYANQPNVWLAREFRQDFRSGIGKSQNFNMRNYNGLIQGQFERFTGGAGLTFSCQRPTHDGKEIQYGINGIFAAGFDFSDDVVGVVGLNLGMLHYSNLLRNSGGGGSTANDPYFKINLDAGIYLQYKELVVGFSILHNNEPTFIFDSFVQGDDLINASLVNANNTFKRASFLNALYNIKIKDDYTITPSILFRQTYGVNFNSFSNNNFDLELTTLFDFKDLVQLGFSYKPTNNHYNASFMVGFKINKKYQFSYSYDLVKKDFKNRYRNMEVGLGFYFGQKNIDLELIENE